MILFVIIFLMTFKPGNLTKENLSLFREEQQILLELNRIGLRLKGKVTKRQSNGTQNHSNLTTAKSEIQKKGLGIDKFKAGVAIQSPPIEYFSQICNQNIDEDSLFDSHNDFLGQSKLPTVILSTQYNPNKEDLALKKNQVDQSQCSFSQISFQRDFNFQNLSQNLKECNDLYRKQHEQLQNFQKELRLKIDSKANIEKHAISLLKNKENIENSSRSKQNTQNNNAKDRLNNQQGVKGLVMKQKFKIQSEEILKLTIFENFVSNEDEGDHQAQEHPDSNQFQCTFKPSNLKKLLQINKSNKSLHQPKQKKLFNLKSQHSKQRIQELSQPRRLKTLQSEHCQQIPSFRPSLSKKSIDQMSNCTYDVATRNKVWLEKKKQKLQKIKEQEELERSKRQSGTYTPTIRKYEKQNQPGFSKFGKQGIINHCQRLSGINKKLVKPKGEQALPNKQNKPTTINESKVNQVSKGAKKQNYSEAVKKVHNRIMGLKI